MHSSNEFNANYYWVWSTSKTWHGATAQQRTSIAGFLERRVASEPSSKASVRESKLSVETATSEVSLRKGFGDEA